MATANPTRPQPRRRGRLIWLLLAAIGILAIWFWRPLNAYAVTGASYGARIACTCHFVAGRELSDCRKDFERGMGPLMLSEDTDEKSVTARFPLLSTQTATFREGQGCVLGKWED
jgi:hypothetical protein